jgi:hypothetical protein
VLVEILSGCFPYHQAPNAASAALPSGDRFEMMDLLDRCARRVCWMHGCVCLAAGLPVCPVRRPARLQSGCAEQSRKPAR